MGKAVQQYFPTGKADLTPAGEAQNANYTSDYYGNNGSFLSYFNPFNWDWGTGSSKEGDQTFWGLNQTGWGGLSTGLNFGMGLANYFSNKDYIKAAQQSMDRNYDMANKNYLAQVGTITTNAYNQEYAKQRQYGKSEEEASALASTKSNDVRNAVTSGSYLNTNS